MSLLHTYVSNRAFHSRDLLIKEFYLWSQILVRVFNVSIKVNSLFNVSASHVNLYFFNEILITGNHIMETLTGILHLMNWTLSYLFLWVTSFTVIPVKASLSLHTEKSCILLVRDEKVIFNRENNNLCLKNSILLLNMF